MKVERLYKVKICGTTSVEDAKMAVDAKADYLGILVDVPISERSLTVEKAKEIIQSSSIPVLVLLYSPEVGRVLEIEQVLNPYGIHLIGENSSDKLKELKQKLRCKLWMTIYLPAEIHDDTSVPERIDLAKDFERFGADAIVIDAVSRTSGSPWPRYGGTGRTVNWDIASQLIKSVNIPVFLAGGINPDNVREAIKRTRPYGVDLASGVEKQKGKRDPEKVKRLMDAVLSTGVKITSQSPEETMLIGELLAQNIVPGTVIALCGDLGSGKTVLTKGIAKGLGIVDIPVTSPTFVLVNQYVAKIPLYHIDIYRLNSTDEVRELGYEEFFFGNGITVIEWAQKIEELLPEDYIRIELEYVSEQERRITIVPYGEIDQDLIKNILMGVS